MFWSQDPGLHEQFEQGKVVTLKEISKYSLRYKDFSFWEPDGFHKNDFCARLRDVAGNLAEKVTRIDRFTHPKTQQNSSCVRIEYRSMERSLASEEANDPQVNLRELFADDG